MCDWSKLDGVAARIAKPFCFTASMFGTFDFDDVADGTQATQKQRKVRRKAELGVEKRPTNVAEATNSQNQTTKVEQVFLTIKEASKSQSSVKMGFFFVFHAHFKIH